MKFPILALWAGAALAAAPLHAQNPDWSQPQKPFRIYGNSWYVGTRGLSAILITSPQGHVLIDATTQDNAAQIEANIRRLGFRLKDIRVILNSHAHFDHAGAIARLASDSGAQVQASAAGAKALEAGGADPDDPQYGEAARFPPVPHVKVVGDGGTVRVGPIAVVAHYTPGHTPGSTSWTWRSCEKDRCLDLAYADSLTAYSRDGYRFSDDPQRVEDFRRSFATVAGLPCDLLITPHPGASGFLDKVAARDKGQRPDPLVDPGACRAYASPGAPARRMLDARLAKERGQP
ncbi:subclass B3 metallo-beta-lactamase [Frateuria sp. Soil773]|uniref:subclass B3 metallo-beta-lactamase n=1 Tax=Frateuria sp. Soil773 TaxID=1736407 RepID=UPI0006F54B9E|nr:subclass B3 metallo-beta-lactamase [Frateuria sp. Soil773]KRE89124.1 subclass B3 metallo-beta-lactamase [Frateuria sp. Soil773]